MTYRLDEAVALTVADGRRTRADSDAAWNIGGNFINGGYLQAVNAAAVGAVLEEQGASYRDQLAVSTVFSAQVNPGPFEVEVDVAKIGRRIGSATARIMQDGVARVTSLVTMGALPADLGSTNTGPARPDVPSLVECEDRSKDKGVPAMTDVIDMRFIPGYEPRHHSDPGEELMCWVRFRDGRPLDPLSLVAFSDIGPPIAFATGNYGWAPTLQMQVMTFCQPVGDTVLMRIYGSPYGTAPYGCEDVDIWDEAGRLVARGRQLAMPPELRPAKAPADGGKSGH